MQEMSHRRRENLGKVIQTTGGTSAVSRALGYVNPSFLSQMTGPNPTRDVSEKAARQIEEKLGLEDGLLDQEDIGAAVGRLSRSKGGILGLVDGIAVVLDELEEDELRLLSGEKFATVCQVLFEHFQREGALSADYVRRIGKLLR